MPKESTIQLYNSSVTGNSPSSGDLSLGELAINTSDEKVFFKNLGGTVLSLSQSKDLSGAFAHNNEVVSSINGATGAVTDVAKTNTTQTFTGLQRFSNGISAAGATFDAGSTVRLSTLASHPQVDIGGGFYSGGNISGEAVNNVYFVAGQGGSGDFPTKPYIAFSNNSTDLGADITFQTLGGDIKFTANTDIDIVASDGNVNISSASGGIVIDPVTFVNIAGGVLYVDDTNNRVGINDTTPSMALCVNGGISGNSVIIAAGATFNSRANFAAGLTTANLFVSGGATFGAAVSITGALAATGATFTYNMSLGTDKNLLKDATFKDFGEVFGYQVRKEINDGKTSTRYYVDLSRGNTFYLNLYGSDNSGILGGYAPSDNLPSIKVPSTAWATVTTTVGLTGATASTFNQGGTIAAGQFLFGPGITSTGCTAVSYNSGTGAIVLSKAAQATVTSAYTAFVRNNGEGFGMDASPKTSVASTFPPARVHSFTLIVGATASASITWQTGATHYGQIKWPSGTAPTLTTTSGKFDVFSFLSYDYGTTWLAFNAGQNF
jgi:hypothetical protein